MAEGHPLRPRARTAAFVVTVALAAGVTFAVTATSGAAGQPTDPTAPVDTTAPPAPDPTAAPPADTTAPPADTSAPPPSDTSAPPADTTVPPPPPPPAPPPPPTGLQPTDSPPIRVPSPLEPVSPGDEGDFVLNLQRRLSELGYWVGEPDAKYSALTTQAVMAFQKYSVMERTGKADQATIDALAIATRPVARTTEGDIAEVDKKRQLVFLVRGGKVLWAFNTSTGSGVHYTETGRDGQPVSGVASTPDGNFAINRAISSGWHLSDLGQLWRPRYFNGGIAFHGATSIPARPASHGCVRLTVQAMDFMWDQDLLPMDMPVTVYSD